MRYLEKKAYVQINKINQVQLLKMTAAKHINHYQLQKIWSNQTLYYMLYMNNGIIFS